MTIGLGAAWALLVDFGAAGLIGGFAIGLAVIFFALTLRVMVEYPYGIVRPFAFLRYFPRFWQLALFGFAYNLTIWCDKLVLWLAPDAERAAVGLISNPARSEEHTSELQSLMRISYAVFCLKKKHT